MRNSDIVMFIMSLLLIISLLLLSTTSQSSTVNTTTSSSSSSSSASLSGRHTLIDRVIPIISGVGIIKDNTTRHNTVRLVTTYRFDYPKVGNKSTSNITERGHGEAIYGNLKNTSASPAAISATTTTSSSSSSSSSLSSYSTSSSFSSSNYPRDGHFLKLIDTWQTFDGIEGGTDEDDEYYDDEDDEHLTLTSESSAASTSMTIDVSDTESGLNEGSLKAIKQPLERRDKVIRLGNNKPRARNTTRHRNGCACKPLGNL